MAELQAALEQFKSEVATLKKQKTHLTQDITVLSSKKTFLEGAIKKLEVAKNLAKKKYDAKINDLIEDLEAIELAIDERKIDLKLLLDKIEIAKSDLQGLQNRATAETTELAKQLRLKKGEITEAEKAYNKILKQSDDVSEKIAAELVKLDSIRSKVKQTQEDADSEISLIGQNIIIAKDKLNKFNDKIDDKAKQYDDLTDAITEQMAKNKELLKQHDEFLEYEKRAKKALQARESALLEGERNLADAKRRNRSSVLDNVA